MTSKSSTQNVYLTSAQLVLFLYSFCVLLVSPHSAKSNSPVCSLPLAQQQFKDFLIHYENSLSAVRLESTSLQRQLHQSVGLFTSNSNIQTTIYYGLTSYSSILNQSDSINTGSTYDSTANRQSDWSQGLLGCSGFYLNTSCLTVSSSFSPSSVNDCLNQLPVDLTQRCSSAIYEVGSLCPPPASILDHTITSESWFELYPNSTCPYYCFHPSQFDSDYNSFVFSYAQPLIQALPLLQEQYSDQVESWSFSGLNGAVRRTPISSSQLGCAPNTTKSLLECYNYQDSYIDYAPSFSHFRRSNDVSSSFFTAPHNIPALPTRTIVSLSTPLYESRQIIGLINADIKLPIPINEKMNEIAHTENSLTLIVHAESGVIISASSGAYREIFCPYYCTNNGADFDEQTLLKNTNTPLTLFDSPYGFTNLLNLSHSASSENNEPLVTTLSLTSTNSSHYVIYRSLSVFHPQSVIGIFAMPVEELDLSSLWFSSERELTSHQPAHLHTQASIPPQQLILHAELNDLEELTNVVKITNSGLLSVEFEIIKSAPWMHLYLIPTQNTDSESSTAFLYNPGSILTLYGSSDSSKQDELLIVHTNLSVIPSEYFIYVTIDWFTAAQDPGTDHSIVIKPITENLSTCFDDQIIRVELTFVDSLDISTSSTIPVLSAVITVFGCWCSLILIEQAIHEYQLMLHVSKSEFLHRKWRSKFVYNLFFSTSASAAALSFCAIFASTYISQSQLVFNNSEIEISYNPLLSLISLIPIFILVLSSFFVLLHGTATIIQTNTEKINSLNTGYSNDASLEESGYINCSNHESEKSINTQTNNTSLNPVNQTSNMTHRNQTSSGQAVSPRIRNGSLSDSETNNSNLINSNCSIPLSQTAINHSPNNTASSIALMKLAVNTSSDKKVADNNLVTRQSMDKTNDIQFTSSSQPVNNDHETISPVAMNSDAVVDNSAASSSFFGVRRSLMTCSSLSSFFLSVSLLGLALFISRLLCAYSMRINAKVSYDPIPLFSSAIVSFVLLSTGLIFFFYLLRFRFRWLGAFIMSGGIISVNEAVVGSINFQYQLDIHDPTTLDVDREEFDRHSQFVFSSRTITIFAVAIAALTCFVLLGLQFKRMKLSRAKLDVLLTKLRSTIKQNKFEIWKLNKKLQHKKLETELIHLLRPTYNATHASLLLAQSDYTIGKLTRSSSVKSGQLSLEQAVMKELKNYETQLSPMFQDFTANHTKKNKFAKGGLADFVKLDDILTHPVCLEIFKDSVHGSLSVENCQFYLAVNQYRKLCCSSGERQLDQNSFIEILGEIIVNEFIRENAPSQVNIVAAQRDRIINQANKKNFSVSTFDAAQKEIFSLLLNNNYRPFLETPQYLLCVQVLKLQGKATDVHTGNLQCTATATLTSSIHHTARLKDRSRSHNTQLTDSPLQQHREEKERDSLPGLVKTD